MCMVPVFFGTTTIPTHHGVGSSIFEITRIDSILVLPWCTVALGHYVANGLAPAFNLIVYSFPKLPRQKG